MNIKPAVATFLLLFHTIAAIAQEFAISGHYFEVPATPDDPARGVSVNQNMLCIWTGRGYLYAYPAPPAGDYIARPSVSPSGIAAAGDGIAYTMERSLGVEFFVIEPGVSPYRYPVNENEMPGTRMIYAEKHLYLASANRIAILDVTDPTHNSTEYYWHWTPLSSFVTDLAVTASGDYVYASCSSGLVVVDATYRLRPTPVGSYDAGYSFCVATSRNRAFLGTVAGLSIIDVSDPKHPTLLSTYTGGGRVSKVEAQGDYVYLINDLHSLEILNVSQPEHPVVAGALDVRPLPTGLGVTGPYIYTTGSYWGRAMQFVVTPTNPQAKLKAQAYTPGSGAVLSLQGTPGAAVQLQRSPDCSTWSPVGAPITLGFDPTPVTDPYSDSHAFYRTILP